MPNVINATSTGNGGLISQGDDSGILNIQTNETTAITVDTSQNVGLKTTPSAWNTFTSTLQIDGASLSGLGANNTALASNAYYNSAWKYYGTGSATLYQQNSGLHTWQYAGSGTAGNNITFAEAMRIDSSGNVGIGTTSPSDKLEVSRVSSSNSTGGLSLTNSDASGYGSAVTWRLKLDAVNVVNVGRIYVEAGSATATFMPFQTVVGSTLAERMRIDSNGGLRIGTTNAIVASSEKLTVAVAGPTNAGVFANLGGATDATVYIVNQSTSGNNLFTSFATEAGAGTVRGSITYNRAGGLTAYNTTSDYRAKDISGSVTNSGALIDSVPVYMGKMKGATQERPMFIAHETPEYAHTGEKDAVDADGNPVYQQMDASALVPVMWAEIQSLRTRLTALESK